MVYRLLLAVSLMALALSAGCPGPGGGNAPRSAAGAKAPRGMAAGEREPVALSVRPYQDVNQLVKDAWFLVETSYFVIEQQWGEASKLADSADPQKKQQGQAQKEALTKDIERKVFGVNGKVEELFKQAIAAEPDNPLNMASYAFYLRARKRYAAPDSDNFANTEKEALDWMDKAIAKWPDEWSFYMLKAFILNEPLVCHEWFRATAMEELAIEQRLPVIRELAAKAGQCYPQNAFINYYKAMVLVKFTDAEKFSTIRDEVLRELKAGNAKRDSFFFFAPPLSPIMSYGIKPTLSAGLKEANFVDQWAQCGHVDPKQAAQVVTQLMKDMTWPKDKSDITAIMYFLYKIGRTMPQDRSVFALQVEVLNPLIAQLEPGSDEALKFKQVMDFLAAQYHDAAQALYPNIIPDRTKLDALGIAGAEAFNTREPRVYTECQGREAAYLKRAGEILGLSFPLPKDPAKW
jgi:hypothetical protein